MQEQAVILLVEDRGDDILLIQKAFARAQVDNPMQVVRDGEEAIAYLSGEGKFSNRAEYPLPWLVLLDLKMPRLNGFEFLKWLRKWDPGKLIPVVVLTSSVFSADVFSSYNAGANSHMTKGTDPRELFDQVVAIGSVWLRGAIRLPDAVTSPAT